MKKFFKFVSGSALVLTLVAGAQSCSMEEPFGASGEGNLTLSTEIRSDVRKTRAIDDETLATLREKCVVYIENSKGVIRKFKGVDNIPENIRLNVGSYVAEAWSGDSVSASFSAKFYRGWQRFEMQEGNNCLTLRCNIANVIASVDPSALDIGLSDLKVTFRHSRGQLDFTADNISTDKGYFMMPNADKDLEYKLTGTKADGSAFEKSGKIENVQRAHEYCLKATVEDNPQAQGGALIRITIADIPVIDEEVEVFTAPLFKGVDFNLAEQVVSTERSFHDTKVYVRGYFGMSSLVADFSSNFTGIECGRNILSEDVIADLASRGINVEVRKSQDAAPSLDAGNVEVDEVYVTFTKAFLDALPASDSEYKVSFLAVDGRHNESSGALRIANSENAVEHMDPVTTLAAPDKAASPMAILSTRATLPVKVNDPSVAEYGIQCREAGASDWTSYKFNVTRSENVNVVITGLKPATTYEYRAYATDFVSSDVKTFTTESTFTIPNASFEEWSTYVGKKPIVNTNVDVIFPGSGNTRTFWDSGNEGGTIANQVFTNKSTDMVHSGTYSARLASSQAAGVLAAGNLFVGTYDKTSGTNGVLTFGRPLGSSTHPDKLVVWVNYRPGKVDVVKDDNKDYIDFAKGDNDHGQIYVALTDETIAIRTSPSDRKLFSSEDPHVLAYGQVTWTDNFGPDGQLAKIEIPIVYKESAKTVIPTHVVITCCASKFGDYFSGSSSSVMYLDDFEFVYE